jgi:hypothetical protein
LSPHQQPFLYQQQQPQQLLSRDSSVNDVFYDASSAINSGSRATSMTSLNSYGTAYSGFTPAASANMEPHADSAAAAAAATLLPPPAGLLPAAALATGGNDAGEGMLLPLEQQQQQQQQIPTVNSLGLKELLVAEDPRDILLPSDRSSPLLSAAAVVPPAAAAVAPVDPATAAEAAAEGELTNAVDQEQQQLIDEQYEQQEQQLIESELNAQAQAETEVQQSLLRGKDQGFEQAAEGAGFTSTELAAVPAAAADNEISDRIMAAAAATLSEGPATSSSSRQAVTPSPLAAVAAAPAPAAASTEIQGEEIYPEGSMAAADKGLSAASNPDLDGDQGFVYDDQDLITSSSPQVSREVSTLGLHFGQGFDSSADERFNTAQAANTLPAPAPAPAPAAAA